MITTIIERVIRFRWVVLGAVAALTALSAYALRTAALDAIPDISDPQIIVYVKWPRSPQVIETEVTEPVIRALSGSADVRAIRGTSHMGYSFVYVVLNDPDRRAALWRDLATGLERDHGGDASVLLGAAGAHLGGAGGLLDLLARYRAYADPLRKKSFLFAKICARRGWLEVRDPDRWQVCADNVLMRLALRSGLVDPGPLATVRASTLEAFRAVATRAGVSPPVLDDLLWERGRDDPDLVGAEAGDLREPPRDPGSDWY